MVSLFGSAVNYIDGGAGDADILRLNILALTNGAANNISLGAGAGAGIEVFGFEQIHLSAIDDVITLNTGGNPDTYTLIDGGDGTDTLDLSTGGGVTNLVFGDGANDTLNLQSIEEIVLVGGAGKQRAKNTYKENYGLATLII